MKKIPLTQGEFALVDNEDYEYLIQYKWYCSVERNNKYAMTRIYTNGKGKNHRMHRIIMKADSKGLIDHKDHNGLNNQKDNLRKVTAQQNLMNTSSRKKSTSKYLGVYTVKSKYKGVVKYKYWACSISIGGKAKWLGIFPYTEEGEIEAAKTYDEAAKKLFKEFANLNFKETVSL